MLFTKYNPGHIIKQDEMGKGIYRTVLMGNLTGTRLFGRLVVDGNTILKRGLKNGL
jgi:hypothetical protein